MIDRLNTIQSNMFLYTILLYAKRRVKFSAKSNRSYILESKIITKSICLASSSFIAILGLKLNQIEKAALFASVSKRYGKHFVNVFFEKISRVVSSEKTETSLYRRCLSLCSSFMKLNVKYE